MSEIVYALPNVTNKARHGRGKREVDIEGRREKKQSIEDIYASTDGPDPGTQQQHAVQRNTAPGQHGGKQ